jgi:prefoldin subunit 5
MSNRSQVQSVQLSNFSVDYDSAIEDAEQQLTEVEERRKKLKAAIKGLRKLQQTEAGKVG